MKRPASLLFAICAAISFCSSTSAQNATAPAPLVLTQDYKGGPGKVAFWWTRRTNECTLEILGTMPARPSPPTVNSSAANTAAGNTESSDRSSFFIGNTIANLRGMDPTFGGRTLTLVDGRRTVDQPQQQPNQAEQTPQPQLSPNGLQEVVVTGIRTMQTTPSLQPAPTQVWLLKQDGSLIVPQRKSAMDTKQQYCNFNACESGVVYGFPLSAASEAVAVAFQTGDGFYIQKLKPFGDQIPQAPLTH